MTFVDYGSGPYGSSAYAVEYDGEELQDYWPFREIYPDTGDALYDVFTAIEYLLDYLYVYIDELYDQRFLGTATNQELTKLAAEIGVSSFENETEDELRSRAKLAKGTSRSRGTWNDIVELLRLAFDTDNLSGITIREVSGEPTTELLIEESLFDSVPINQGTLADELQTAVPVSDDIQVVSSNAFRFDQSGSTGLSNGKLS